METRMITYAELQEADDARERASRAATMPMTPTERAIERERIEVVQEMREQNGDPKANRDYEERLQFQLSPMGRYMASHPGCFRMYTFTGEGIGLYTGGDWELYCEVARQAEQRTIPGGVAHLGSVK